MIRVLVVDDHREMLLAIVDALSAENDIDVVAACMDGREALDVFEDVAPDVVLTDLVMPRVDGAELTRQIRRSQPGTRVIVLTASPERTLAAEAAAAGADRIIAKSGDIAAVLEAIRDQ